MIEPAKITALAPQAPPREQVIGWLLEGHRDSDIKQAVESLWPNEDPMALMHAAVDHFAKAADCDRAVVLGWAMEAYRDLYRRLLEIGDFANAMKAVKELVALASKHSVHPKTSRHNNEQDRTVGKAVRSGAEEGAT